MSGDEVSLKEKDMWTLPGHTTVTYSKAETDASWGRDLLSSEPKEVYETWGRTTGEIWTMSGQ